MRVAALATILLVGGCTTGNVEMSDGTRVQFTRFATDAAVKVDKDGLSYSSSPSAVAQQNALDVLSQLLTTAIKAGLVVAQPAAPMVQQPSAFLAKLPQQRRTPAEQQRFMSKFTYVKALQTPLHEGES